MPPLFLGLVIVSFLLIFLLIYLIVYNSNKESEKNENINKKENKAENDEVDYLQYFITLNYHGGIPGITETGLVQTIQIYDNCLKIPKYLSKESVRIPYKNIVDVSLKTDEQISKDVTLTRLITLGVFAFGAKKKTKTINHYLIIKYMESNIELTAVFSGEKANIAFNHIQKCRVEYSRNNPTSDSLTDNNKNLNCADEIEKLYKLKERGIITEEEFNTKKKQLLDL